MRVVFLACLTLLLPVSALAGGNEPYMSLQPPTFSIGPGWGDYTAEAMPTLSQQDRAQLDRLPDGPPFETCRIGFWIAPAAPLFCRAEYAGASAVVANIAGSVRATQQNLPQPFVPGYDSSDPSADPNVQACVNAMTPFIPALQAEGDPSGSLGWPGGLRLTCQDIANKYIDLIMTHD